MKDDDSPIFVAVFVVWVVLALVYATVPALAMPGYALVWGWGSLVFLLLAGLTANAVRRGRRRRRAQKAGAAP